jgi:site-specific recombinase XerD
MHDKATLEKFLNGLTEKGLSAATIKAYKSVLNEFDRFANNRSDRDGLEHLTRAFIEDLKARQLRPQTINRAMNVLRLLSCELQTPCSLPKAAQQVPQPVKILSDYEWTGLQNVLTGLRCTRDNCIVRLIMETGLRPLECCHLSVGDLSCDSEIPFLLVRGRSGERRLMISPELKIMIGIWLREREQLPQNFDPALFLTRQGRRLNLYTLDQIVRKTGIKARINVCAQTLRNTALSRFLSQGTPLEVVNKMAGQRSLRITERYGMVTQTISTTEH